jgi:hypothetical protein
VRSRPLGILSAFENKHFQSPLSRTLSFLGCTRNGAGFLSPIGKSRTLASSYSRTQAVETEVAL